MEPSESARKWTLGIERRLSLRKQLTETVDSTASFEAEGEDREPDVDGEASLGQSLPLEMVDVEHDRADDEPDHDSQPSIC